MPLVAEREREGTFFHLREQASLVVLGETNFQTSTMKVTSHRTSRIKPAAWATAIQNAAPIGMVP